MRHRSKKKKRKKRTDAQHTTILPYSTTFGRREGIRQRGFTRTSSSRITSYTKKRTNLLQTSVQSDETT